ncbi:hypothetical protein AQUCO_01700530v1 [Aquilegia coerulea]|uniref:EGF-like domain-containing protein n=1 Tax=Aquilegia coerulea TaxID=218851 RepID=A0A2G5DND6_AQUCA|nr:hypothetical protein AQUCO_01700530v1 [Aquilegia coerulea]PIA45040.1 hypothetical protein AQUCO_01700530v1 [Aquilegia coerulea]
MSSPITYFLIVFLSLFLLLKPTISSDFLAPLLSPFIDELCKDVLCGKGKCKTSTDDTPLGYMCECDQGWKQTTSDEQKHLRFLPCVIPNCTLDTSCTKAQSPSPQVKDPPKNTSFFDPCKWAYCGEGSCMKASTFGHKCECQEGYANLLNSTVFPCFTECSFGMDCANLGLTVLNKTTAPTSVSTDKSDNHASSILLGNILLLMLLMLSIGTILTK